MKKITFFFILALGLIKANAQATLTVVNNSDRVLQIKVMSKISGVYKSLRVESYGSNSLEFSESGNYYLKTKALSKYKAPIYKKGNSFYVTNSEYGYSQLTLTISIQESDFPSYTEGVGISKNEFDRNDK